MRDTLILSSNWDTRYLALAWHFGTWSKDPSRQIGAVAIGPKGEIIAQGYNGFPRGIEDTDERYEVREEKYKYVVHAEMNCIYNAASNGVSLKDSTVYVHGLPACSECAKGLIQVGVKRVMAFSKETPERWIESNKLTEELFKEANIEYETITI
jgi:dCMP deaminase|tara:strand:- start:1240 stop:1701 length:462 start_codon:yes stop_codon:yes gene_type:complete